MRIGRDAFAHLSKSFFQTARRYRGGVKVGEYIARCFYGFGGIEEKRVKSLRQAIRIKREMQEKRPKSCCVTLNNKPPAMPNIINLRISAVHLDHFIKYLFLKGV